MISRYAVLLLAMFCTLNSANARAVRMWSYEELLKASDLVAIIEPISSEDTKDPYPGYLYGHALTDFSGHNTKFKVHAILKGSFSEDKMLTVLHFSYSKDVNGVANGASFVQFIPGPLQFKK